MHARRRSLVTAAASAAMLATVAAGCSEPPAPEPPAEEGTDDGDLPPQADEDPARDELSAALGDLHETIVAAEARLRSAAEATGTSDLRVEAQRALGSLLDGAGTRSGTAVLPSESPERGNIGERDDLLSLTLALARDVGGDAGTTVVALLRDELAGDLGAWERDAEGVVASVARTAATSGDLERLTTEILELPGETTRALAWTMVAMDADDLDTAATAASRAASHLELAAFAIEELLGSSLAGSPDRSDDA